MPVDVIQIAKDDKTVRRWVDQVKAFRLLSLQTSPESFLSTYSREIAFTDDVWYERLSNPKAVTFIAVQSGHIVSSLAVLGPLPYGPDELSPLGNPWFAIDGDPTVKILNTSHWRINGMFTLPEARGQGIAKALIEAAKKFCATQAQTSGKDHVLSIAVEEDNLPAKALYQRCGFVTIKEQLNRSDSRRVLLMKWEPLRSGGC
jgi:ribosomal protein S18 acetylase RimI-like enzyme